MDHTRRSVNDNGGECDLMNCGGLPHEVSDKKKINMCLEIALVIFLKNVVVSCLI